MIRTFVLAASSFMLVVAIALVATFYRPGWVKTEIYAPSCILGKQHPWMNCLGTLRLVYFGYLNCPDVCLTASQSIGSALKNLEAADPEARAQVTNVFVTLDPSDDVIDGVYNELAGYMDLRYDGQGFAMRPTDRREAEQMAAPLRHSI